MQVVEGTRGWRLCELGAGGASGLGRPVVAIGNFDGVHRGHRALIDAARARAATAGGPAAVLTFDPAPRDVLRPENGIPRIQTLDRKLAHLRRAGLDATIVQPFDRALAAVEPEDFARRHLAEDLGAAALVVGHDFRFGRMRRGDAALLRETLGVEVIEVAPVADAGGPISSSRVREALAAGRVAEAAGLLGRPHELTGVVVEGDRRGRTIGFPTANLSPGGGLVPPAGVYAVRVDTGDGEERAGVANLGVRPTFDGTGLRLEVHVLDFAGDLYGRTLVVGLVDRIREERRFPSIDALVAQIRADADEARRLLR